MTPIMDKLRSGLSNSDLQGCFGEKYIPLELYKMERIRTSIPQKSTRRTTFFRSILMASMAEKKFN